MHSCKTKELDVILPRRNISSMRRGVSSQDKTLRRKLKIRRVFLTNFEVFLVMKHSVECFILRLKQNEFRRRN